MKNYKLTKNFSSKELRCKGTNCCGKSCPMDTNFMKALQVLRTYIGISFKVTSGLRCNTHNSKVEGSAKNSAHCKGLAADIQVKGMTPREVYNIAKGLPEFATASFGVYNSFLHVSTDGRSALWFGK